MTYRIDPVSQSSFRVQIGGIVSYFTTVSGWESSRETTPVYDGLNSRPSYLTGLPENEPLELSKPFDYSRDKQWLDRYNNQPDSIYTITIQPLKDGKSVGEPWRVIGAKLTGIAGPEVDATSSDVAMLTLTFSYSGLE